MSDQFVAEIRIFPFDFAPVGWAFCNGQILLISQNAALFSLLGTNYGGNGITNFGLPNLQGSVPVHVGGSPPPPGLTPYKLGQVAGSTNVTVTVPQLPAHSHTIMAAAVPADLKAPATTAVLSRSSGGNIYLPPDGNVGPMATNMIGPAGGSKPHNNLMPYLVLNFCIALSGIYPTRG